MNAKSFEKKGYSLVLEEEELDDKSFIEKLGDLYEDRNKYIAAMGKSELQNAVDKIVEVIKTSIKK